MFYRVRTRLTDTPGALAMLAQRCGDAGVNILALQIYPELGAVTDDLVDQPTAWLRAARVVLDEPAALPAELTALLGARVSWSATEQVRAAALTELADRARSAAGAPPAPAADGAVVEYVVTADAVQARIGSYVVGAASLHAVVDGSVEASLEVAPAWRRLGIGRQLLRQVSGLAAGRGATELVMLAPPTEEGVVPVLAAAGMRGRIRLTEQGLSVHVSLAGVRPIAALVA